MRRGAARGSSARSARIVYTASAPYCSTLSLFCERESVPLYSRRLERHSDFGSYPRHKSESADCNARRASNEEDNSFPFPAVGFETSRELRSLTLSQRKAYHERAYHSYSHLRSDNYPIYRFMESDRSIYCGTIGRQNKSLPLTTWGKGREAL